MRNRTVSADGAGDSSPASSDSSDLDMEQRTRSKSLQSPHSSFEIDFDPTKPLKSSTELDKWPSQQIDVKDSSELMQMELTGQSGGSASVANASMNFVNSIVGAGIIGLPFALRRTGIVSGVALLVFVAALTDYGCRLLVLSGVRAKKRNFETLCEHVFGTRGYYAVLIFMSLLGFGAMCVYLIVVGDTIPEVAHNTWSTSLFVNRTYTIIIFSFVLVLPLSMFRDMATLAMTSSFSMLSVVVIVLTVAIRGPSAGSDPESYDQAEMLDGNPYAFIKPTFFAGIGSMSFAFVCHHNSFIVFNSMEEPSTRKWTIVTHLAVGTALILSLIMAVAGYLSFLGHTQSDILNNFSHHDDAINVSRVLLAFSMILTFPMEMFVVRHCIIEGVLGGSKSLYHHVVSTLGIWALCVFIAVLVEDLGIILELTGAFSASCLGYILPALCYIHVVGVDSIRSKFALAWARHPSGTYTNTKLSTRLLASLRCSGPFLMLAFGVVAMIAGTVSAFM